MANVTFGNIPVDMRLTGDAGFGIQQIQSSASYLNSFNPIGSSVLSNTSSYMAVQLYDASYSCVNAYLWITNATVNSMTLSKLALEVVDTGFYVQYSGSLTATSAGAISGTITGFTHKNISNGAVLIDGTGFNMYINSATIANVDPASAVASGLSGNDSISGGASSDYLMGFSGNDTLRGNAGADTLNGGAGNDTMIGGVGNDTYVVNVLADVVTELAGEGTDTIQSGITYSLIDTDGTGANGGNIENLTLTGTAVINGTGNALVNTLTGNGVANILNGLGGNDILRGGAGNDILIGGAGKDTLTGGTGADKFDFNAIAESVLGLNHDVITDFARSQADKVDLSTIDAKTAAGLANDTFAFITGTTFTAAGQVRYANGVIYGNTDADAQAEFEIGITLVGVTSMLATDFIL